MSIDFWDSEYKKETFDVPESIAARKAVDLFKKSGVKTVLDAGCGIGQDAAYLAKKGFTVHGIDFSKTAIEKANKLAGEKRQNLTFECKSIVDFSIPKGKFDAVFCNKVIQLLLKDEREAAVKNIYGCLKNNGIVAASVISREDELFGTGKEIEERTFKREDGRTVHYFTEDELAHLFSKHGFSNIKTEKFEEFGPVTKLEKMHIFLLISATKGIK